MVPRMGVKVANINEALHLGRKQLDCLAQTSRAPSVESQLTARQGSHCDSIIHALLIMTLVGDGSVHLPALVLAVR